MLEINCCRFNNQIIEMLVICVTNRPNRATIESVLADLLDIITTMCRAFLVSYTSNINQQKSIKKNCPGLINNV